MNINPYETPTCAIDLQRPRPSVWLWLSTALAAVTTVAYVGYSVMLGYTAFNGNEAIMSEESKALAFFSPLAFVIVGLHLRGLSGSNPTLTLLVPAVWATVLIYIAVPLIIVVTEGLYREVWAQFVLVIAALSVSNFFATARWYREVWEWHHKQAHG